MEKKHSSRETTLSARAPWYRHFLAVCGTGITCLFLAGAVFGQEVKSGQDPFLEQLKEQGRQFLDQQRFSEMLDYLAAQRAERTNPRERFYVDYYTALTKSQYLDHLNSKEDWQHYYALVHAFDAEIINTSAQAANDVSPAVGIDMRYLAWKAYLREEDEDQAESAFGELVNQLVAYTSREHDVSPLREMAKLLVKEGKTRQLSALFAAYKDHLLKSKAAAEAVEQMAELAAQYAADEQMDMAQAVYEHYIDIIVELYAPADCIRAMLRIADTFRNHQFRRSLDAEFAETVYARIEKKFGKNALSETALFARAYNLYTRGEYDRADEEWVRFVTAFPSSVFTAEAYTRRGIINRYFLGREEEAGACFRKVMEEFPASACAPLCIYQSALFSQFKEDTAAALELYGRLIKAGDKEYAAAAKTRCYEIDTRQPMDETVRYPLELMSQDPENATIVLTLMSEPNGVFIDKTLLWKATAQDFSAGTVQPLFQYRWFWDTGSNNAPGNVTEFETSYAGASPRLVCFSAKTGDSEGVIFGDVWVYDCAVLAPASGSVPAGTDIRFNAEITPATIDAGDFSWQWQISGPESFSGEGTQFSRRCEQPGHYQGSLTVRGDGVELTRQFSFDVAGR